MRSSGRRSIARPHLDASTLGLEEIEGSLNLDNVGFSQMVLPLVVVRFALEVSSLPAAGARDEGIGLSVEALDSCLESSLDFMVDRWNLEGNDFSLAVR